MYGKLGDETTVNVSGDLSDEEINRLKEEYPDAEIRVEGKSTEKKEEEPVIEVIEEEETE